MDARPPLIAVFSVIAIAIGASGCGTTEKSGQVGDELSATAARSAPATSVSTPARATMRS
jgi:hypothetical protein